MTDKAIVPSSDSDWQVFNFGGIEVHGKLDANGEPIFMADEVCKAAGITNTSQAVSRLDDDEKAIIISNENGVPVRHLVVNEPGLYSLLGASRKKEAKSFKRFVNHEILPAIRRNGAYVSKGLSPLDAAEAIIKAVRQQEREIAELRDGLAETQAELHSAQWQRVTVYCDKQGIKYTASLVQKWTRVATALSQERGIEIRRKEVFGKRWATEKAYHVSVLAEICGKPTNEPANQLTLPDGDK